jgi:hypothetical protein
MIFTTYEDDDAVRKEYGPHASGATIEKESQRRKVLQMIENVQDENLRDILEWLAEKA